MHLAVLAKGSNRSATVVIFLFNHLCKYPVFRGFTAFGLDYKLIFVDKIIAKV